MSDADRAHWARVAADWIAWARAPGHDAFWYYRAGLAALIGPGGGEALDVGCGEGRVSRLLGELGYRVTAADAVAEMVAAAREADSAADYAVAPVADLPFADRRFPLVVAYNVLMDVEDVDARARRAAPGDPSRRAAHRSRSCIRCRTAARRKTAAFVLRVGLVRHRPVPGPRRARRPRRSSSPGGPDRSRCISRALRRAGFAVTDLREPRPDPVPLPAHLEGAQRRPVFLWMVAEPHPG